MVAVDLTISPNPFYTRGKDNGSNGGLSTDIWKVVLERDKYTCQGCGFPVRYSGGKKNKIKRWVNVNVGSNDSLGYLMAHHLDGNNRNDAIGNLIALCPFCHGVLHFDMADANDGVGDGIPSIVLCPWMGQAQINLSVNLAACAIASGSEWAGVAAEFLEALESLGAMADEEHGMGASDAFFGGTALLSFRARMPKAWEGRKAVMAGLRLIPSHNALAAATDYWAKWPDISKWPVIYEQWKGLWRPVDITSNISN